MESRDLTVETATTVFFDRDAVLRAVEPRTRRLLSRFGAYVRQRSRGLIRSAGKKGLSSKPGQPPKSQTGLLKKFIFFAADIQAKSVVIGPVKLHSKQKGSQDIPRVLEHGGKAEVRHYWPKKTVRTYTIAPRPYMKPAFDHERERMKTWGNDI